MQILATLRQQLNIGVIHAAFALRSAPHVMTPDPMTDPQWQAATAEESATLGTAFALIVRAMGQRRALPTVPGVSRDALGIATFMNPEGTPEWAQRNIVRDAFQLAQDALDGHDSPSV